MELGPQNHNGDGRLGPNSIIVVYMDPLGLCFAILGFLSRLSSLRLALQSLGLGVSGLFSRV